MTERKLTLRVITEKLPQTMHGISAKDGSGYIVLINEDDTPEQQAETFLHEMGHIYHGDHDRQGINVNNLEAVRHLAQSQKRPKKSADPGAIRTENQYFDVKNDPNGPDLKLEAGQEYTAGAGHYTITSIDGDTIRFTVRDVGGTFVMGAEPFKKMIKGEV